MAVLMIQCAEVPVVCSTLMKPRLWPQLFRLDDREVRRQQVSTELGVQVDQLKTLPRALRQAAASGHTLCSVALCCTG